MLCGRVEKGLLLRVYATSGRERAKIQKVIRVPAVDFKSLLSSRGRERKSSPTMVDGGEYNIILKGCDTTPTA